MTKDEALKLALEALEYIDLCDNDRDFLHPHECFQLDEAITAIKQALAAQQKHEPENEPYVSLASVREDWGPGPHEYHSLPSQPAPVQPVKPSLWEQYHAAQTAPVQEPVAWMFDCGNGGRMYAEDLDASVGWLPLYTAPPAAQPAPAQPVACFIGAKGSAFDLPETKRAYTYKEQPGNAVASKLGRACEAASKQRAGDNIDRGLGLLQELQKEGFGVFALGAEYTTPPVQPAVPDSIHHTDMSESLEYIQGWNDCRQAMLEMMK